MRYLIPPELRAQEGLVAPPQESAQLQLLADALLGTERASAAALPPYPCPHPCCSPRSAGPGHGATGRRPHPCGGPWGRRPGGPGHHGGTPGGRIESGPGWRTGAGWGRDGVRVTGVGGCSPQPQTPGVLPAGPGVAAAAAAAAAGAARWGGPRTLARPCPHSQTLSSAVSVRQPHPLITRGPPASRGAGPSPPWAPPAPWGSRAAGSPGFSMGHLGMV